MTTTIPHLVPGEIDALTALLAAVPNGTLVTEDTVLAQAQWVDKTGKVQVYATWDGSYLIDHRGYLGDRWFTTGGTGTDAKGRPYTTQLADAAAIVRSDLFHAGITAPRKAAA